MKLSEWKLYSIYALGHILQGSPEADEKYLKILFKYLMGKECNFDKTEKSAPTATAAGKKPEKLKIRCSAEWWFHKKSHHSCFVTETETKYYETKK